MPAIGPLTALEATDMAETGGAAVAALPNPRLRRWRIGSCGIAGLLFLAACAQPAPPSEAVAQPDTPGTAIANPMPSPNPLRNAYFGDLHVHTRNSYDAYIFNVRTTPDDAHAYARGGAIKHPMGFELRLKSGPLDFLAVTDHAEYLGVLQAIDTPGTEYSKVPFADQLFSSDRAGVLAAFMPFAESLTTGKRLPELADLAAVTTAWQETIDSAERYNEPGSFTTFVGYEFTSLPEVRNLHRNVIFAGGEVPAVPYSALESQNPEDLWRWMDERRAEGIEALAIPHNSNASDGTMFERVMWNGEPIDRDYAELRVRNEPLVEILQTKGQSETMPLLSPNDEFADFEVMTSYVGARKPVTQFAGGYVRDALKRGLEIENEIGVNPYKVGIVAASDTHNAGGSFEEDNYYSKVGVLDGLPEQRGSIPPPEYQSWAEFEADGKSLPVSSTWGTGGLTGLWAEENTRASLFAALRRKEAFGTSGTRIRVRLFGGHGLEGIDLATDDGVRAAYARGVPMGGDLQNELGRIPEFVVLALRDIHSAPLQRIQIVKGWTDGSGRAFEKVIDVACSDNGKVDPGSQRCHDNGATVDLTTCAFSQDKGDAMLQGHWTDPDFEPGQNAFYYVRVLENPTCRWSTWDAIRAGMEPNPRLQATVQERAFTSPIWLKPTSVE
jgi:hypothetical protein